MATRKLILDNNNNEILPITDTESVRNPQSIGGTLEGRLATVENTANSAIRPLQVGEYTEDNFVSFDANGGIKDSDCNEASFATAAQGAKADTAVQQVTVGTTITGAAGSNASVTNSGTSTAPVLDFTIPRGADAVNPFKGYYPSTKPTGTFEDGDYIYAPDSTDGSTTTIWYWDKTLSTPDWSDSGKVIDPAALVEFANTSKAVAATNVVNDLTTGGVDDVLSAEQGKSIANVVGGEFNASLDVEQGSIDSTTGDNTDSANVLRTIGKIHCTKILVNPGIAWVVVFGYNGDSFISMYPQSSYLPEGDQYVSIENATDYRFIFLKKSGAVINPSEFASLGVTVKVVIEGGINEKVEDLYVDKVDIASINLIDLDACTTGKGINASGVIKTNQGQKITDYIPVRGRSIISNGIFSSFWGGAVYDRNKIFIRALNSAQYTYVEGDYYIRLNFGVASTNARANYGTTLNDYTPYNPIAKYLNDYGAVRMADIQDALDSIGEVSNEVNGLKAADKATENVIRLEVGGINLTNGKNNTDDTRIRFADLIPIGDGVPNWIFFVPETKAQNGVLNTFYYNADGNFLSYISSTGASYYRIQFSSAGVNVDTVEPYMELLPQGSQNYVRYYTKPYFDNITQDNKLDINYTKEIAVGKLTSNKSYNGELEVSPIVNLSNQFVNYVGYDEDNNRSLRDYENLDVVAINHDDTAYSDIVSNRKIYNKYGFHANYNYILMPFSTLLDKEKRIKNMKELSNDGHDLGLHAILNKSYWLVNKLFDVRPDSTFTFAPILSELKGSGSGGTGTNAFGISVTSTTKASSMYLSIPADVTDPNVVDMTEAQLIEITRCFSVYADYKYKVSGYDLDGNKVSKTVLQWLEYWYNNLIDNTLGYSSEETSMASKYAADYGTGEGAGTYPDAAHLKSGKIVFYDDTTNVHYNDSDYQKVGRFTKGLFKGYASCCNYEVVDRCISIAEAVIKHYYGITHFTSQNPHGVGYFRYFYVDNQSGLSYADRERTILENFQQRLYNTKDGMWESTQDVFMKHDIKVNNYGKPEAPVLEGQVGLYYGQKGIRSDFFSNAMTENGAISYLNFFGTGESETMNYDNFTAFLLNQDNWLKFAYENAGQSVTQNNKTYTVFTRIKSFIDALRACKGTGKIPQFSYDTIMVNPSISTAISLISKYCYDNNIKIVTTEEARALATSHRLVRNGNVIPNPAFNQSVVKYFGGSSTSPEAYVPDGWSYGGSVSSVSVDSGNVTGNSGQETFNFTANVLSVTAGSSSCYLQSRIYGLEAGKYRLSLYCKSSSNNGVVELFVKKNKDYIQQNFDGVNNRFTPVTTINAGNGWTYNTYEFEIADFVEHEYDGSDAANVLSQGFEDNVSNIVLKITAPNNGNIQICKPSLMAI